MEWILGSGLLGLAIAVVFGFRWTIEANKSTAELFSQTIESTYAHLKEASPIGGLPRDLWLEQHELRKRELELRERQLDIETPLRQEALRAKLMKAHKLNSGGRVTNPEA